VGEDIPFHDVVNHEKARAIEMEPAKVLIDVPMPEFNDIHEPPSNSIEVGAAISASLQSFTTIEEFYESSINSFGEFKTEIIAL
jgi:hypothetical protein